MRSYAVGVLALHGDKNVALRLLPVGLAVIVPAIAALPRSCVDCELVSFALGYFSLTAIV
jgi:hypothetical protein